MWKFLPGNCWVFDIHEIALAIFTYSATNIARLHLLYHNPSRKMSHDMAVKYLCHFPIFPGVVGTLRQPYIPV